MQEHHCLVAEPDNFPYDAVSELFKKEKISFQYTTTPQQATILFIRLGNYIDSDYLKQYTRLKHICCPTTGLNHIDIDNLPSNISLFSLKGHTSFLSTITPTADLALSLILLLQSSALSAALTTSEGSFDRAPFFRQSFNESSVGLIGLGRIGTIVARYLHSLGFKVFFFDNAPRNVDLPIIRCKSLEELFMMTNTISIHVSYSAANHFFLKTTYLEQNPPYNIINTSRGELFSDMDLSDALKRDLITTYATDVVNGEPFSMSHPFNSSSIFRLQREYGKNRIFITPHIGGASLSALKRCELYVAQQLIAAIRS